MHFKNGPRCSLLVHARRVRLVVRKESAVSGIIQGRKHLFNNNDNEVESQRDDESERESE